MTPSDTVVRFFHDVDRNDWSAVRRALTGVVDTDYTSLFGGSSEQLPADDLVARWRGLVPGFDATQHLLGPVVPATDPGGETECRLECNVRAHHRLAGADDGGDEWLVVGRYAITARRDADVWRLSAITLQTSYQAGNPALVELASARVADLGHQP